MVDDKKILKILRENPKQLFSAREIAETLREPMTQTFIRLKQLIKYKMVESEKISQKVAAKIYGPNFKRSLTLYYVEPGQ